MRRAVSLEQGEQRLAIAMLVPAFAVVFSIIILPVLANFWVSFKSIGLGDLRPPQPIVREQIAPSEEEEGILVVRYRLRNSSQNKPLQAVRFRATIPAGLTLAEPVEPFSVQGRALTAEWDRWEGGHSVSYELRFVAEAAAVGAGDFGDGRRATFTEPTIEAKSRNPLTDFTVTLANYRSVLQNREFLSVALTTLLYTLGGSLGAIGFGLCAAVLVNRPFAGRGLVRGLLLFPYVAPIIAVAFTWTYLLDPFSGTINALLIEFGIIKTGIGFFSERHVALVSVIFFDAWRYFPFAFLFILARLQAIPNELYESAQVDGANPFQRFFGITLPLLRGVLGTIFLLRFIWTFNRFDDIFLLTGGVAGTKTLPIEVYDNAFGRSDIGAGSAVAVILFALLALFLVFYLRVIERKEIE